VARGFIDVHRRLTARVGGGGSIDECLGILARATAEFLDADIGAILLLDERRPVVRLRVVQGARSPRWREGLDIPLDGTLNGAAIRTGAVQRVDDWQLETGRVAADVRAVVAAEDVRSLMVAPLLTESGVVGTLAAARRTVRPFGEDADFLLQLLADQAALQRGLAERLIGEIDRLASAAMTGRTRTRGDVGAGRRG
jgi:GAF domain-containing protein